MSFGQSLTMFLKEWGILLVTLLGAIPGIYFAWSKLLRRGGDAPVPALKAAPVLANVKGEGELAEAYVLFCDIVGYSKQPMEIQRELIQKLQQIIGAIPEYENALGQQRVIAIPTGDGMALAFFHAPDAPVRCAIAVAKRLRQHPEIKLRMGINSGPVYRVLDINRQLNVSGAGINMAQRVMDCGDAGHILVSRSTAEILREFSEWKGSLVDLGEAEVKHGVKVHIFNMLGDGYGNAEVPAKLKIAKAAGE
jgi:class 3 adenylate cyclase